MTPTLQALIEEANRISEAAQNVWGFIDDKIVAPREASRLMVFPEIEKYAIACRTLLPQLAAEAKRVLDSRGVDWNRWNVTEDTEREAEIAKLREENAALTEENLRLKGRLSK